MRYSNAPQPTPAPRLFRADSRRPSALLERCPHHAPTPLRSSSGLAGECGVAGLALKDESARMGLASFKALGGAFAVAQLICDRAGGADVASAAGRAVAQSLTFITASAGNHGLSVAAGARVFGARAVIVLAAAVPEAFAERIRGLGAQVVRVDGSYEDSVAHAATAAEDNDWLLLADGSWEGYIERPALVMEGYTVLAEECRRAFESGGDWPTHVFLQAGVGGLAAAVAAHVRDSWRKQPRIVVVEPESAPCLLESVKRNRLVRVAGEPSNMGRLDCKEASLIAWSSLRDDADDFITVSDGQAADAVRLLGRHGVPTTPSGASSLAGLLRFAPGANSRCLVIVSEGPEEG